MLVAQMLKSKLLIVLTTVHNKKLRRKNERRIANQNCFSRNPNKKYKIYQQVLIVAIVNLVTNCIGYWLEHLIGQRYYEINFLYPALITALCWPLIYLVLQILCATFSVVTEKDNID